MSERASTHYLDDDCPGGHRSDVQPLTAAEREALRSKAVRTMSNWIGINPADVLRLLDQLAAAEAARQQVREDLLRQTREYSADYENTREFYRKQLAASTAREAALRAVLVEIRDYSRNDITDTTALWWLQARATAALEGKPDTQVVNGREASFE